MVICHHDDRWSGFVAWQPSDLAGKDTKDKAFFKPSAFRVQESASRALRDVSLS